MERGESDQRGVTSEALPCQLADIELATRSHRRSPSVAHMRVVLPDNHLGMPQLAVEVCDQSLERASHVRVTKVPRGDLRPVHLVVVLLRIADQTRVLLGVELLVLGHPTVTPQVQLRSTPQL